jgi:mandelamide amidase
MWATDYALTALARAIARGECSAEEVAREVLRRCAGQRQLRALIAQDPGRVLEEARAADRRRAAGAALGPLHGVPVLIKDNIDVAGYPTTAGTPGLEGIYPPGNAPVVQRLLDAGAIVAGKANLHELAVGGTSQNDRFGHVVNPWRADVVAGGSSGGSAVAVAARLVPAALGTDTNGSVRGPCSMNGIAGLRPSFRRYPYGGTFPGTPNRDSVGGMAPALVDVALLDAVLAGESADPVEPVSLRGLRFGRPGGDFVAVMDERTAGVMDNAVRMLEEAGAEIVAADLPGMHALATKVAWPISAYEVVVETPKNLAGRTPGVKIGDIVAKIASAEIRLRFDPTVADHAKLEHAYRQALDVDRPKLQAMLAAYFRDHRLDALIFPTTPFPAIAVPHDTGDIVINGRPLRQGFAWLIQNTVYQSASGIPSLTVPAGLTPDGLPVGLSFDGPLAADRRLLAIGMAFEQVRGPFPLPPLAA